MKKLVHRIHPRKNVLHKKSAKNIVHKKIRKKIIHKKKIHEKNSAQNSTTKKSRAQENPPKKIMH